MLHAQMAVKVGLLNLHMVASTPQFSLWNCDTAWESPGQGKERSTGAVEIDYFFTSGCLRHVEWMIGRVLRVCVCICEGECACVVTCRKAELEHQHETGKEGMGRSFKLGRTVYQSHSKLQVEPASYNSRLPIGAWDSFIVLGVDLTLANASGSKSQSENMLSTENKPSAPQFVLLL